MSMTLPMPLGFQYTVHINPVDGSMSLRVAPVYHDNTVAAQPALRYLASIFGVRRVRFTYGEFAAAMAAIGLFDDQDEGMLLGWQQPFPYNPAGLPLNTVVTRRVQADWRAYMQDNYGWNVYRPPREGGSEPEGTDDEDDDNEDDDNEDDDNEDIDEEDIDEEPAAAESAIAPA